MSAPLLSVEHLSKSYGGVKAVQDVSFSLDRGELLVLIGPNGAGKSTCFNMLNGQVKAESGTIRIDGRDTTRLDPRRVWKLGVGRTFQITATFASMSVRENVQVGLLARHGALARMVGFAGRAHTKEADQLLELVGMREAAERPSGELAYGDLKRLELAVALSNEPSLLLMDEPTAGMAPTDRVELMRLAAEIARSRRIGILFTEHDMDVVFEHADRIMVLDRGQIIATGTPQSVRQDPKVRAVYLGEGHLYRPAPAGAAA
ncbi:MAG: transporter related [Enterovirga sp.]|nr:transporter related [Enterovirga sp.]